jgi:hypothetical protein
MLGASDSSRFTMTVVLVLLQHRARYMRDESGSRSTPAYVHRVWTRRLFPLPRRNGSRTSLMAWLDSFTLFLQTLRVSSSPINPADHRIARAQGKLTRLSSNR